MLNKNKVANFSLAKRKTLFKQRGLLPTYFEMTQMRQAVINKLQVERGINIYSQDFETIGVNEGIIEHFSILNNFS